MVEERLEFLLNLIDGAVNCTMNYHGIAIANACCKANQGSRRKWVNFVRSQNAHSLTDHNQISQRLSRKVK